MSESRDSRLRMRGCGQMEMRVFIKCHITLVIIKWYLLQQWHRELLSSRASETSEHNLIRSIIKKKYKECGKMRIYDWNIIKSFSKFLYCIQVSIIFVLNKIEVPPNSKNIIIYIYIYIYYIMQIPSYRVTFGIGIYC